MGQGRKTEFAYSREYDQKNGSFTVQTIGPSKSYEVYELPFTPENVQKLYHKTEDENVSFVLKDMKTGEARSLSWSSVKDSVILNGSVIKLDDINDFAQSIYSNWP